MGGKPKAESAQATQYQLASQVAKFVDFDCINLVKVRAGTATPPQDINPTNVRVAVGVNASARRDREAGTIIVGVEFIVQLVDSENCDEVEGDSRLVDLSDDSDCVRLGMECKFALTYWFGVKDAPDGEEFEPFLKAFADVNGVYNAWPYLRELFDSNLRRMGVANVVLPVYRVDPNR